MSERPELPKAWRWLQGRTFPSASRAGRETVELRLDITLLSEGWHWFVTIRGGTVLKGTSPTAPSAARAAEAAVVEWAERLIAEVKIDDGH
jgi:hypothetical protein